MTLATSVVFLAMLAGTIVARNYLAHAVVVATSFLEHHPQSEFVTLVIDGTADDRVSAPVPGPVVLPEDLGLAAGEWEQMAGIYTLVEFATALKPAFLRYLLASRLEAGTDEAVCYLDPDIEVYRSFSEVVELAEQSGIVLTPHVLHPLPRDGSSPDERALMLAGLFNLGFLCVGRRALPFLDWWHERLRVDGVIDPANALFTDQRWVDWVPSLFDCHVLDDHGMNVAYWNAHERPLERAEGTTMLAAGTPLKFFHFSGFEVDEPWRLSKHAGGRPRCTLGGSPLLAELCNAYAAALEAGGYREHRNQPYRFGTTATGLVLTPLVRAAYRAALVAAQSNGAPPPPCPFGADDGAAFEEWLALPVTGASDFGISRWHVELWKTRPDLMIAFPDLGGLDAGRYRQWLDDDAGAQQVQREVRGLLRPPTEHAPSNPARSTGGWNVVGYFSGEFGIGEAARRMGAGLKAAGLSTDFVTVSQATSCDDQRLSFRDSLYCVNADQFERVVATTEGRSARDGRRIGLWFWEVDQFPAAWQGAFAHLDEVWCASAFTSDVIRAASPVPVHTVPLPVWAPSAPTPFRRDQLGLPSDRFVFLFNYDFNSVLARKNPLDLVDAYVRAFSPDDGASLVLKSINGSTCPLDLDRVQQAVAGRPDIVVHDGYLDAHRLQALIELSDCYVSLHRCEGFGLNLAAAMAAGKPVIATGYSGNLTFMDATSAFLVPFELVPVGAGHAPYPADAHWAQPDLDAAAGLLRLVFDQPDVRQSIAARGRDLVLDRLAPERVGAQVADRLLDAMLCAP